jgi:hypothetical protein
MRVYSYHIEVFKYHIHWSLACYILQKQQTLPWMRILMQRFKQVATLFLGFVFLLAVAPASADTLYSNTNFSNNSMIGSSISPGTTVQSFTLTQDSTVTGVNFSAVTVDLQMPGIQNCFSVPYVGKQCTTGPVTYIPMPVTDVNWEITDLSSGILASGNASSFSTTEVASTDTEAAYQESFSIPSLQLSAGTYDLQLYGAFSGANPGASWESINNSSSGPYGLQILGTEDAPSTMTPEPSSFLLLGSGLAGLAGFIKRKLTS